MKILFLIPILIFSIIAPISLANAVPLSNGDYVVAEATGPSGNGGIYHFSSTGSQKDLYLSANFGQPLGIAIDKNGDIVVGDQHAFVHGAVLKTNPITRITTTVSSGGVFAQPSGVTIDSSGNIFVADPLAFGNGAVIKVDPTTGAQTPVFISSDPNVHPYYITIDKNGDLLTTYVSFSSIPGGVLRINPVSGASTTVSSGGNLQFPLGIRVTNDGSIFVADNTGRVIKVDPTSGTQTLIASGYPLACPTGLAIDATGNLLVDDPCREPGATIKVNPTTGSKTILAIFGISPSGIDIFNPPVDSTPPVIAPTITGTLGNNGWYTSDVSVSWTVTDPESPITSPACTTTNITTDTIGQTVSCTATSAGGTSSNSVTIKRDATPPTITAPSDITVIANNAGGYSGLIGTPTANDNFGSPTVTNDASSTIPLGVNTITWTATDGAGLQSTATQKVTVIAPLTITAPAALSVNTDPGVCTATNPSIGTATTTGGLAPVTISDNRPNPFQLGQTTVTWTAKDSFTPAQTASATQLVTIIDNQSPTITAPSSITKISSTSIAVSLGTPTTTDNCPGVTYSNNAPATFPIGTTIVTWTATDGAGLQSTATQTVTIQTPAQAITGLTNTINTMGLPTGEQTSLGATLKNVDTSSPSACGKLNAFVSKVNVDLSHGLLTSSQASILLSQANAIKAAIGCP